MPLSKPIEDLLATYTNLQAQQPRVGAVTIHVDEIAAKLALFYEKIRNIVDYQEEHLMREKLILRVLKRRLLITSDGRIAEAFIKDIIRSGHLKNDSVPEYKINEIQCIIDRTQQLLVELHKLSTASRKGITEDWVIAMTGNAIEEQLFPPIDERLLFELMYQTIKPQLVTHGFTITDDVMKLELCIAIQRTLFRVDEDRLMYRLITFIYPQWSTMNGEEYHEIVQRLCQTKAQIHALIHHQSTPYFLRLCNRYNTVYFIIGDIIKKYTNVNGLKKVFEHDDERHRAIITAYNERYVKEHQRLQRLALFSVISFFISKIAIALAIEIPIEVQLTGDFSWAHTMINISVPPLLMVLIVSFLRMPGAENKELVVYAVDDVILGNKHRNYMVTIPKKRHWFTSLIVYGLYGAIFIGVFYGLWRMMEQMGFNIANTVIFALFLSLVIAAGVKIHNRAKELSLEGERATLIAFIFDIVAMPFITVGQWLIKGIAYFNIVVLLINLLIELPFQFFVEFLENFRGFILNKKDELR